MTPHLHGNFIASVRKMKATCMRLYVILKKCSFVWNIISGSYIMDYKG